MGQFPLLGPFLFLGECFLPPFSLSFALLSCKQHSSRVLIKCCVSGIDWVCGESDIRVKVLLYLSPAPRHCLLGCSGPDRPQRKGLSRCLKVPRVNLSSGPVPTAQGASRGFVDAWTDTWTRTDVRTVGTARWSSPRGTALRWQLISSHKPWEPINASQKKTVCVFAGEGSYNLNNI